MMTKSNILFGHRNASTNIWPNYRGNAFHSAYNTQLTGPTSKLLSFTFDTFAPVISSPAVDSQGNLYFGSISFLFFKLSASGVFIWNTQGNDQINTSPSLNLNEDVVYYGDTSGTLYAVETSAGSLKWSTTGASSFTSSPYYYENKGLPIVFIGSNDDSIYGFNALNGSLKWSRKTNSGIDFSSPVVFNQILYIGSTDTTLRAYNALSGQPLWLYNTSGSIRYNSNTALVLLYLLVLCICVCV